MPITPGPGSQLRAEYLAAVCRAIAEGVATGDAVQLHTRLVGTEAEVTFRLDAADLQRLVETHTQPLRERLTREGGLV